MQGRITIDLEVSTLETGIDIVDILERTLGYMANEVALQARWGITQEASE